MWLYAGLGHKEVASYGDDEDEAESKISEEFTTVVLWVAWVGWDEDGVQIPIYRLIQHEDDIW